ATEVKNGGVMSVDPEEWGVGEARVSYCTLVAQDAGGERELRGSRSAKPSCKHADRKIYEIWSEKKYSVTPDLITFTVTATNHTDHVLRLAGAVPRLNIDSLQVSIAQEGLSQMGNSVLVPNDTVTFSLVGPKWDESKEKAVIDFQIFDVVVESDAAGNPTAKEHFKWTYQAKVENKTVEIKKTKEQKKLSSSDASALGCPVAKPVAAAN